MDAVVKNLSLGAGPEIERPSLQEAEDAMDQAVADFIAEGVNEDDLERIKMQLRAAQTYARDNVDGIGNRYGFPKPEVVARWQASGAQIWRSDQHGAVQLLLGEQGLLAPLRRNVGREVDRWEATTVTIAIVATFFLAFAGHAVREPNAPGTTWRKVVKPVVRLVPVS